MTTISHMTARIALMHIVFVHFRPEPMVLFSLFATIAIVLSLYLLPRFKGAIVGYQWAKRMFGFSHEERV